MNENHKTDTPIEDFIKAEIKKEVLAVTSQIRAQFQVLNGFENVETLTLQEVSEILRLNPDVIREAVKRNEIPGIKIGRSLIFPKYLIALFLLGEWEKPQKESKNKDEVFLSKNDKKLLKFISD